MQAKELGFNIIGYTRTTNGDLQFKPLINKWLFALTYKFMKNLDKTHTFIRII